MGDAWMGGRADGGRADAGRAGRGTRGWGAATMGGLDGAQPPEARKKGGAVCSARVLNIYFRVSFLTARGLFSDRSGPVSVRQF